MSIKHLKLVMWVGGLASIALSGACGNDPYSQRRIQSRTRHMNQTIEDYAEHDRKGSERLEQRRNELDRWWKSDEERTRYNFEVLGDYVW
jgi:hypothetical protein